MSFFVGLVAESHDCFAEVHDYLDATTSAELIELATSPALRRWLPDGHFHAVRELQITRRYVRATSGTGKHPTKPVGSHSFPFPAMLAWLRAAVGGGFAPRRQARGALDVGTLTIGLPCGPASPDERSLARPSGLHCRLDGEPTRRTGGFRVGTWPWEDYRGLGGLRGHDLPNSSQYGRSPHPPHRMRAVQ